MSFFECSCVCPYLRSLATGVDTNVAPSSASYKLLVPEGSSHLHISPFSTMAPLEVSAEVYEKCCSLGSICGDKGTMWIARHKPSSSRFILKIYELDKCRDEFERIKDEITLVRQLRHRNIIQYLASFYCGQQLCIVMPLVGYTSASRLVASHYNEGLSEQALSFIIKDVLRGLHYLHSKGIIHRSIKGTHILVDNNGRSILCGFRHSINAITQGKWEKVLHSYPPEAAFNLNWASPELLKQDTDGYCEKTDIYSLGITICELGNGEVPYCKFEPPLMLVEKFFGREPFLLDGNTCKHMSENGKDSGVGGSYGDYITNFPKMGEKYFSSYAHQFVSLCLTIDVNLRPSAERLLDHAFIRQTRKIDMTLPELLHPVTPITEDLDLGKLEEEDVDETLERNSFEVSWDI